MISIRKQFSTEADAVAFRDNYLSNYHPMGYGTRLDIRKDGDVWLVTGTRFASCD